MRTTRAVDPLPLDFSTGKGFYVYLYRDPRPRKGLRPIYVGKGKAGDARADVHWSGHKRTNTFFARVLNKIRAAGLLPIIEVISWFDNEAAAFHCEIALINQIGRRDLGLGPLCNLTNGGEGTSGHVPTAETRAKRAASLKGRTHTTDARAKISAAKRGKSMGRPRSAEHCAKLSVALRGKPKSTEAVAKMAARMRGRPGRPHTPEGRAKISAAKLSKNSIPIEIIVSEYNGGSPCTDIGKCYGVAPSTIARRLKAAGVPARGRGQHTAETRAKLSAVAVRRWRREREANAAR